MSAESIARMTSFAGHTIPLVGVHLSGSIEGNLLDLAVAQHYENGENVVIEAVYTFPLPLTAVLLSFELEIGERRLAGVVRRKREASEAYAPAVEAGDAAALLEHSRDGLYTVSLGNLQAGERATVRFRFAQLLDFDGGRVRAAIPTALAPRYGNASRSVAAHQVPVTDILAQYPLTMNLAVRGELARAPISSPTHLLTQASGAEAVELSLGPNATLDRDLVLLIDRASSPPQALLARDGENYVALMTFTAPHTAPADASARNLKLLVDCSGSMDGSSIGQAGEALRAVIGSLVSGDNVSLTRFGSGLDPVTRGLEPVTPALKLHLADRIGAMRADLGGTEIGAAIAFALAIPVPEDARTDMLLITDGEVWELDAVLRDLAHAGHRLFVIAVGRAPVEELGRKVAATTGGACEFVTPGENMRDAVARQLGRIGSTPATVTGVDWSAAPDWCVGVGQLAFPGDSLHLFASFRDKPSDAAHVTIGVGTTLRTITCTWPHSVTSGDSLARIAAARRLPGLATEATADLAEQYSLITAQTSCVVALVRPDGEKSTAMPALRAVPQMMLPDALSLRGPAGARSVAPAGMPLPAPELLDRPSFLRPPAYISDEVAAQPKKWVKVAVDTRSSIVESLRTLVGRSGSLPSTLLDLAGLGVETRIIRTLQALVELGHREADVVVAWLAELMQGPPATEADSRLRARLERAAVQSLRMLVAGHLPDQTG